MDAVKDLFYGVISDCTHLQRQSATCAAALRSGCAEPEQGVLRSGFLRRHVMMSLTISYEGQAGQKCRGWLSCRYIFLRAKPDYGLHMSAKAAPPERSKMGCVWVSCELRLSPDGDAADGAGTTHGTARRNNKYCPKKARTIMQQSSSSCCGAGEPSLVI